MDLTQDARAGLVGTTRQQRPDRPADHHRPALRAPVRPPRHPTFRVSVVASRDSAPHTIRKTKEKSHAPTALPLPDSLPASVTSRQPWPGRLALVLGATALLAAWKGGGDGGGGTATLAAAPVRLCPSTIDYSIALHRRHGSRRTGQGTDRHHPAHLGPHLSRFVGAAHHGHHQADPLRPHRRQEKDDRHAGQETGLPTEKLNQCAYQLLGASLDPARPARLFVGQGVMGGTIPGARIQFNGIAGVAGSVPDTTFPFFQFIGFAQTETDLTAVAGTYNGSGFREVPSKKFQSVAQDWAACAPSCRCRSRRRRPSGSTGVKSSLAKPTRIMIGTRVPGQLADDQVGAAQHGAQRWRQLPLVACGEQRAVVLRYELVAALPCRCRRACCRTP